MPSPRFGHCIFCDDLRYETGNKISLMGLYFGDLYVDPPLPTVLSRFVIAVWLITDIDDAVQSASIRVLGPPDRTQLAKIDIPVITNQQHKAGSLRKSLFFAMPISPFVLTAEGDIEVLIDTELGELRAGRLEIHVTPPAAPVSG